MYKFLLITAILLVSVSCEQKPPLNKTPVTTIKTEPETNSYSRPLSENRFWDVIGASLKYSGTNEDQYNELIASLMTLEEKEIVGFQLRLDLLMQQCYTSGLWCAATLMNDGCDDEEFENFRLWLISMGKDVFYAALNDPDTLVDYYYEDIYYEMGELAYVASEAFDLKTGEDIEDFIDYDNVPEADYPDIDFDWDEDDDESMRKICPNLYDASW